MNATGSDIPTLVGEWRRYLRSQNLSLRTIESYTESALAFAKWKQLRKRDVTKITRAHIEGYLADGLDRGLSANTVARDYRHLRQFFRWCVIDESIQVSPMEGMSPPKVPVEPVPVLSEDEQRALIAACEGKTFTDRRDLALVRFMLSTGVRLGEVAGMTLEDLDLDVDLARVFGKARVYRSVPFGDKTHQALRRYLRERAKHPKADSPALWLGRIGPLTKSGIQQIVERRSILAGMDPAVHPHQLRHTFAHEHMAHGGNETDLMALAGWKSRLMVERYGKSAQDERARENRRRMAVDDRF